MSSSEMGQDRDFFPVQVIDQDDIGVGCDGK